LEGKKTLLILPEFNQNVFLSGRNIKQAKIANVADINVYDILNANTILVSEKAVEAIKEQFSNN